MPRGTSTVRKEEAAPPGSRLDMAILARTIPDLWPRDRLDLRLRVIAALILLVAAKGATIVTPFFFGWAVDGVGADTTTALAFAPLVLVAAYALVRLFGRALQEGRDMIFARVTQHALRKLAKRTFAHIHRLSLAYHLSRRTGELSRVTERGIKAIEFLMRYVLFSIVPLFLELG
ncbi:MAG: ABC transporter transmembrane domain-containing protein, partial [Pseudomonadota bacterium]